MSGGFRFYGTSNLYYSYPRMRHSHRQHCRTETLSVGKKVLGKKREMQRQVYLVYSFLTFQSWQRELKGQERPGVSPQVCLHLRGRQSSVPGQPSSQLYEFTSSVPTSAPLDHSSWEHCGHWALSAVGQKSM